MLRTTLVPCAEFEPVYFLLRNPGRIPVNKA
jgi:hypothetical protein